MKATFNAVLASSVTSGSIVVATAMASDAGAVPQFSELFMLGIGLSLVNYTKHRDKPIVRIISKSILTSKQFGSRIG